MTLDEYEKDQYLLYRDFAEKIRFIVEEAIAAKGLHRPQSIQSREKSPGSLRKRLIEKNLVDSDKIEIERKDLAGVRPIFYTDNHVEQFLQSRIIYESFKVEKNSTKIHYPTVENDNRRYQALHFIVGLGDERTNLPEYAKFKGLRCEIQVHTILNHAWSETSHDIYKDEQREGFANKSMESISKRLDKVMDKYLLPAGREFARIQHDYERVKAGKALFDSDVWKLLADARDNNVRYDLLSALKNELLPNYDDLKPLYTDFIQPLVDSVKTAKATPAKPIETTFGSYPGKSAAHVTLNVIEILEHYRYLDIEGTFHALSDLFREEADASVRTRIIEAVRNLANFESHVWTSAGPYVQSKLVLLIDGMDAKARQGIGPILAETWGCVLKSEVNGTDWTETGVTLSSGSVSVSSEIKSIRSKAMAGLFDLYLRAENVDDKRHIVSSLREATSVSNVDNFSNELLALTIENNREIVEFLSANSLDQPYELLQSIEHEVLFDYRRAGEIIEADDKFRCRDGAQHLVGSIERFRDKINADPEFVRYKLLVGYDSVFPFHWETDDYDYQAEQAYRTKAIEELLASINHANAIGWLAFIERCAQTKSNDGATFPPFLFFLQKLAGVKPAIADDFLQRATPALSRFLSALLDGLFLSGEEKIYQGAIERCLQRKQVSVLARHWRNSKPEKPNFVVKILNEALELEDETALLDLAVFAMQTDKCVPPREQFLIPAMLWLTARKDTQWSYQVGYSKESSEFLATITDADADLLLANLMELPKIHSSAERILEHIGRSRPRAVWDYIGKRLARSRVDDDGQRYEAVPHRLHELSVALSKDIPQAISSTRAWYSNDKTLFKYGGGRFLSAIFPNCPVEFAEEMEHLVREGASEDADFVLATMTNFRGSVHTHPVFKAVISRWPDDSLKQARIRDTFMSVGPVWGQYGIVESMRATREIFKSWSNDPDEHVSAFARSLVLTLNLQIAREQKRADDDKASGPESDDSEDKQR